MLVTVSVLTTCAEVPFSVTVIFRVWCCASIRTGNWAEVTPSWLAYFWICARSEDGIRRSAPLIG